MKKTKDKMLQYLLSTFDDYLRSQELGLENISVAEIKLIATRVDWPGGWRIHNTYGEIMQMDIDVITSYRRSDPEERYMKGDAYNWLLDNQDNLEGVELTSLRPFTPVTKYRVPRRHRDGFKSFVEITKHTDDWWWVVIHCDTEQGTNYNTYKCDQMSGMLSLLHREMPQLKKRLNNL